MTGYIGTYKGTNCYVYSKDYYIELINSGKIRLDDIYIIDGDMVKNGMCIGYYDGNQVEDKRPTRYEVEEKKVQKSSEEIEIDLGGLKMPEINFDDYMKKVNEFFKKLES